MSEYISSKYECQYFSGAEVNVNKIIQIKENRHSSIFIMPRGSKYIHL